MYTFKLQPVLDHRQLLEDNIKKELAEIRQQAHRESTAFGIVETKRARYLSRT